MSRRVRPGFDLGLWVARLLCAVLALLGLVPFALGALVKSEGVRARVAVEAERLLKQELGLTATHRVEIELLPLSVAIRDLVVPASDGGSPVLSVRRVAVRPRLLSLLSGRLDAGDVEIDDPVARVVLRDGALVNLDYRLPERPASTTPPSPRPPFGSLAIANGRFVVDIDGTVITTGPVDLDVFAETGEPAFGRVAGAETGEPAFGRVAGAATGPAFDVVLRAGESTVRRARPALGKIPAAIDEDVLCRLDARLRWAPGRLTVRRLDAVGVADDRAAEGTQPPCRRGGAEGDPWQASGAGVTGVDPWRVALRVAGAHLDVVDGKPAAAGGRVTARAPLWLVTRFTGVRLWGWAGFSGDVSWQLGQRLPDVSGRLLAEGVVLDGAYRLGKKVSGEVAIAREVVRIPRLEVDIADAHVTVTDTTIRPFAPGIPISTARVDIAGLTFPGLMRDINVTPNTIVQWDIDGRVTRFEGTLDPLRIDGALDSHTRNFMVFDRAWHHPGRQRMIGVEEARVLTRIGVRPGSFDIYDGRATFGQSDMSVRMVSIGYDNVLHIKLDDDSRLHLADISPLVTLPIAGTMRVGAELHGPSGTSVLTGQASIQGFELSGFPLGDIQRSRVRFTPLVLQLFDVVGKKGKSEFSSPSARLDFDTDASIAVDAVVRSKQLDIRDFFDMWHFDEDPRFDPIMGSGEVDTRVRYVLGGRLDRCGGGLLRVEGSSRFGPMELFEERYDGGEAEFDFRWLDRDASYLGMEVDLRHVLLKKGGGTLLGSGTMRTGGVLRGQGVGTAVPLAAFQSLGPMGPLLQGNATGVAEVSGTVDAMVVDGHAHVTPVRVGAGEFPASDVFLHLEPIARAEPVLKRTRCGGPVTRPFDRARYEADEPLGVFQLRGSMFGGQVKFTDLGVTRQRKKHARGEVRFAGLDLGALFELTPAAALLDQVPAGRLSARVQLDDFPLDDWASAQAYAKLTELELRQGGARVELQPGGATIGIEGGRLGFPRHAFRVSGQGARGVLGVSATVTELGGARAVDATVELEPTPLRALLGDSPRIERAEGTVGGGLRVRGPPAALSWEGGFSLRDGTLAVRGLATPITDIQLGLTLEGGELRVTRGQARIGAGRLALGGGVPIRGTELGAARFTITGRDLALPTTEGMDAVVDADLVASWSPAEGDERSLPLLSGNVTLQRFAYTRRIALSADLSALGQRGRRTTFEAYDPAGDSLGLDIVVRATRPLTVRNNLVEAEVEVGPEGLALTGTNQRYGVRGSLGVKPGGRVLLRQTEFEIREGRVRFDDPTRIAPEVDVTATTEYMRYSDAPTEGGGGQAVSTSATSAVGGRWRITLRAHGDAENLKVDLTSDPALGQDDIFLLLTVGVTRAELDSSVGESVALEALGTLTGADRAVTAAIPIIDEFRFGSAYSSRTGRTEPTVTVGKALTRRVRVTATSGLSESREVRSNLEVRLSPRVSVEGSYDNVNDLSSSLGNLGANIRWRLEFE